MIKTCPRCASNFECKEDDILKCDCVEIKLSTKTRRLLGSTYNDCLCPACLVEFENETMKGTEK